jgi:hypothetical protein
MGMAIELGWTVFWGVLMSSFLPFVAYKLATDDFASKLPLEGTAQGVVSFFMRFGAKMIADFCMTPIFRHPAELGIFWIANLFLLPIVHCYVSWSYSKCDACLANTKCDACLANTAASDSAMGGEDLFPFAELLVETYAILMFFWALLFWRCEKSKLRSFFSMMTGREYYVEYFRNGEDDIKMDLLRSTNKHFFSVIEGEIKDWIQHNWELWQAEESIDLERLATIPEAFIPSEFQTMLESIQASSVLMRGQISSRFSSSTYRKASRKDSHKDSRSGRQLASFGKVGLSSRINAEFEDSGEKNFTSPKGKPKLMKNLSRDEGNLFEERTGRERKGPLSPFNGKGAMNTERSGKKGMFFRQDSGGGGEDHGRELSFGESSGGERSLRSDGRRGDNRSQPKRKKSVFEGLFLGMQGLNGKETKVHPTEFDGDDVKEREGLGLAQKPRKASVLGPAGVSGASAEQTGATKNRRLSVSLTANGNRDRSIANRNLGRDALERSRAGKQS